MSLRQTYTKLTSLVLKAHYLRGINGVLEWDQQVVMPPKSSDVRGEQMAVISGMLHDLETDSSINEYLQELEKSDLNELNEYERKNVYLIRKDYDKKVKVPKNLVEECSKLSSTGFQCWVEAKKESNFSKFAPILKRWIELRKEIAALVHPKLPVYDALLDDYEPELTTDQIQSVFDEVKKVLVPLIAEIRKNGRAVDCSILKDTVTGFDVKKQEELNKRVATEVAQFSFDTGRLDVSAHPFTIGISTTDVRITSRFRNDEFLQGLAGTIHESGHALYEAQLNPDHLGQPVSQPLSMGFHESQSLFWERHVLLSKSFWEKQWNNIRSTFPHIRDSPPEEIYQAANALDFDNLIRVEADEVTYPLHIILRFEIEKGLFDGSINVDDLPTIWNQKMKDYLGIEPTNDSTGVLQDVHWSSGAFGYFPTYTLGAMYAAQLASLPQIDEWIKKAEYGEICKWLGENVHKKGSVTLNANKLLEEATGEKLNASHFVKYLTEKYNDVYKLK
ncbi:carboxypeptidase [Acrasis kona]|uniref:Carboxypeptidase n=1 Tax=Acrasis kona TaxID=1008807 RepID=A0AAW2ZNT8_9EUKA